MSERTFRFCDICEKKMEFDSFIDIRNRITHQPQPWLLTNVYIKAKASYEDKSSKIIDICLDCFNELNKNSK